MDWEKRLYLTFDIEWASDEIIEDTLELIENAKVTATFFVTHYSPILERLRSNPMIELGIHPNFNPLLSGNEHDQSYQDIIQSLKAIVPEAVSVRSHSLTQSSHLLNAFCKSGLTHDVNLLIPKSSGIILKPFENINGIIRIPFFWEDDCACSETLYDAGNMEVEQYLNGPGLKVFNFHPIHVFLNTENLERYESTRDIHDTTEILAHYRYRGFGTQSFLMELINKAKSMGMKFNKISDIIVENPKKDRYCTRARDGIR